jgi:hypothetical protein
MSIVLLLKQHAVLDLHHVELAVLLTFREPWKPLALYADRQADYLPLPGSRQPWKPLVLLADRQAYSLSLLDSRRPWKLPFFWKMMYFFPEKFFVWVA